MSTVMDREVAENISQTSREILISERLGEPNHGAEIRAFPQVFLWRRILAVTLKNTQQCLIP